MTYPYIFNVNLGKFCDTIPIFSIHLYGLFENRFEGRASGAYDVHAGREIAEIG